jgi:hypothetical protein
MFKKFIASLLTVCLAGCPAMSPISQSTLATWIATLGSAASQIATIEGDATLATQLQTDTAAAAAAVKNFVPGTDSAVVVEALNLVLSDLNLFTNDPTVTTIVDIAILATEGIIALLPQPSTPVTAAVAQPKVVHHTVVVGTPITTPKEFKRRWNLAVTNTKYASAAIK